MGSSYSELVKSSYFTTAFNSAIYDGALRIYFAQFNEDQALELYFEIQQRYQQQLQKLKVNSEGEVKHLLILLYPTEALYRGAFGEGILQPVQLTTWKGDILMGVQSFSIKESAPFILEALDLLFEEKDLTLSVNSPLEILCE